MKIKLADGTGTIDLRYLLEETLPSGATRVRFRRKGQPPVTLHAPIGSDAFLAEYRAALAGQSLVPAMPTKAPRRPTAAPGSLRALIARYCASADFKLLDVRTQRVRRQILEAACDEPGIRNDPAQGLIGDQPFAGFTPKHVRILRDRKAATPEAANSRVKALRQVFAWAVKPEVEEAKGNPARDVPYIRTGSQGFHTWTLDELRRFTKRHPVGTKACLAFSLLFFIGSRRADVTVFGKQHLRDAADMPQDLRELHGGRWLHYTQHKNRKRKPVTLEIPLLPELAAIIDASPCGDLTFLVTEFGKPFTHAGFGNWFADRCAEADVPGRAHGLRKAGASIAAERGASERQLMAIFGWQTSKEAVRYTRAAEQRRLAGGAMRLIGFEGWK